MFKKGLILFLLALLFYFGKSKIKKIDCQINKTPCPPEIEKEFEAFLDQNFFLSNPKISHPQWERVRIKKIPFHKIFVEITTRQPVACLLMENKIFLLDKEAVIVKEVDVNPGLPEIETEKFAQETVKKALEVIVFSHRYFLVWEKIRIQDGELIGFLPEKITVLLPQKDLSAKIASLQMIISQAKIEGKLPKKIDLRFKKPVVTYD